MNAIPPYMPYSFVKHLYELAAPRYREAAFYVFRYGAHFVCGGAVA
jgi:hypothetical protein